MPRSVVGTVLRKELRETFRDRRTLFSVVISPLLITPLLLALMGAVLGRQVQSELAERILIGVVGLRSTPSLRPLLQPTAVFAFHDLSRSQAEIQVRDHRLRAAILLPPDAEARLRAQQPLLVELLVDGGNEASRKAGQRLQAFFGDRSRRVVLQRLAARGLSRDLARPFVVRERSVAGGGNEASLMLALFLPYMLVLSSILGGVYAANDLVAGEKERGTLEALLVSPACRRDLVMGKFLTVTVVSLVSSVLSVVGLVLPFWLGFPGMASLFRAGFQVTPVGLTAILLVQVPIAVLGAGLLLIISTYARNQKEAQSYLNPVMILVSVAAMLSLVLKAESPWPLALAPILNAALALKQALNGSVDPLFAILAVLASILYAALAMSIAVRLFQLEGVLLKA